MAQKIVTFVDVSYLEVAVESAGSNDAGKVVGLDASGKVDISVLPYTIPTGGMTGQVLVKKSDSDYDMQWSSLPPSVPTGVVEYFAMATTPSGWLVADGSAVSRTTYANLFNAIGTLYGTGDGSTTFNLPDLRGEFVRGFDNGRGVDSGRVFGSVQADEFKSHYHEYRDFGGTNDYQACDLQTMYGNSSVFNTSNTGGTETRPRNVALLACIKY